MTRTFIKPYANKFKSVLGKVSKIRERAMRFGSCMSDVNLIIKKIDIVNSVSIVTHSVARVVWNTKAEITIWCTAICDYRSTSLIVVAADFFGLHNKDPTGVIARVVSSPQRVSKT